MEKLSLKELSARGLIDIARTCMAKGDCFNCALFDEDSCTNALILALADKLEEATRSPSVAFSDSSLPEGAIGYDDRLTARENGHAYFIKCFEEPCLGGGCKDESCEFMWLVCERLCKYEEGARVYGIEWIPFKAAKPTEDDEYLVMVAGAEKPTTLWYDPDEEAFYEEGFDGEAIWYPVTHWAMLPVGPNRTPSADGYTSSDGFAATFPSRGRLSGENTGKVRRCATCRHEDRMAECDRCLECEKHSLWEERK